MPSLKSLDRCGNVIQIDSFSKIAFPGLRVGWRIGPRAPSSGCGWSSSRPICIPISCSGGACGIHSPRLSDAASGEDEENLPLRLERDGRSLERIHAGRRHLDAPGGRHVCMGYAAAGFRRGRALDSRARARYLLCSRAALLFAAAATEHATAGICHRLDEGHHRGAETLGELLKRRISQASARGTPSLESPVALVLI